MLQAFAQAQPAASPASESATTARWLVAPQLYGRITAAELGLLINVDDPQSVAVGEYYARRRDIPAAHVLRVRLPVRASLSPDEFESLRAQVQAQMPASVQGLALAWTQPYAVACNSITSALALGFQAEACHNSCAATKPSPYGAYAGSRPFSVLGMRPAMMLAGRSVASAQALIERGIAADHSLQASKESLANAWYISTSDAPRNVRARLFPPATSLSPWNVNVRIEASSSLPLLKRTLLLQTGLVRMPGLDAIEWLPGALADHLTSFGGLMESGGEQMSALEWLEAGATASYGTVSEPCNYIQKFPHPQFLLLNYLQGVSALEAYWRSVAWPVQGVFIGEPLAAPFAPR